MALIQVLDIFIGSHAVQHKDLASHAAAAPEPPRAEWCPPFLTEPSSAGLYV